jgi:hypothetical protein
MSTRGQSSRTYARDEANSTLDYSGTQESDDDACGKLWQVYVDEAARYDEGLVKSWKEDMDVVLVFVSSCLSYTVI